MRNAADYVTPDLFAEYRAGEDLPENPQPSMHELSLGHERLPIRLPVRPRHFQDRG